MRAFTRLAADIAIIAAVFAWQIRRISVAALPELRAIEALGIVIVLFLVAFSGIYLGMSHETPFTFTERLDQSKALYFTITIFSTVGFGDITPRTDAARLVCLGPDAAGPRHHRRRRPTHLQRRPDQDYPGGRAHYGDRAVGHHADTSQAAACAPQTVSCSASYWARRRSGGGVSEKTPGRMSQRGPSRIRKRSWRRAIRGHGGPGCQSSEPHSSGCATRQPVGTGSVRSSMSRPISWRACRRSTSASRRARRRWWRSRGRRTSTARSTCPP